jgi:hypothetical protein
MWEHKTQETQHKTQAQEPDKKMKLHESNHALITKMDTAEVPYSYGKGM